MKGPRRSQKVIQVLDVPPRMRKQSPSQSPPVINPYSSGVFIPSNTGSRINDAVGNMPTPTPDLHPPPVHPGTRTDQTYGWM